MGLLPVLRFWRVLTARTKRPLGEVPLSKPHRRFVNKLIEGLNAVNYIM